MSIRSINYNINASSYGAYNQKLTSSTKKQLEEAGIPYNKNMTESEGRKLLSSTKSHNEQSLFSSQENNSLKKRAIELAKQLGININEDMELQQILALIEQALEQKIAISKNDLDEIKKLREFSSELASLQAAANGSSGYDNTNQALMMSLEMLSEYNKNFFNK